MAAYRVPVKSSTARHLTCPGGVRSSSPGQHLAQVMSRCEMGTYQQAYHNQSLSQKPENEEQKKKKNEKTTLEIIKSQLNSIQKMKNSLSGAMTHITAMTASIPRGITSDFQKYIPFIKDASQPTTKPSLPPIGHKKVQVTNDNVSREQHSFEEAMQGAHESVSSFYNVPATSEKFSGTLAMKETPNVENMDKETNILGSLWNIGGMREGPKVKTPQEKKPLVQKDFVSRVAIDSRTRALVHGIKAATSNMSRLTRTEEFCKHLLQYPNCRSVAYKENIQPYLLKFSKSTDKSLRAQANEALALIGYVPRLRGRGIRMISIDGGGTRGLVAIETLRHIQEMCPGSDIRDMFDYVIGVSTGSLIAAMVFLFRISLDEAEYLYKEFSKQMFSRNRFVGTSRLMWNHAFYDSNVWETILKEQIGHKRMSEFARNANCPKFSGVSCVMNLPTMKNFLFRNYNLPPGVHSYYPGNCRHRIWEVIRASSAAPGYFEQFDHGDFVHQDGGLLTNNPTALGLHECRLLWPNESVQCVISLGTGRYEPTYEFSSTKLSLKDKLSKIVDSATDTEAVHVTCQDLLPPSTYFRFNPYMSEMFFLDEIRPDKLDQLEQDTKMYIRKNKFKMQMAVSKLEQTRRPDQVVGDWIKKASQRI